MGAMDVDGQQVYSNTTCAVMETIMWVLWMWMDSRCTVHNMCGNGDHHVGAMDGGWTVGIQYTTCAVM